MIILQSFLIALEMLQRNKLRAALTMLGVIIGVMSVTMIVMISTGFKAFISGQFASLGSDTIFVFFDPFTRMRRGQTLGATEGLTLDDIDFILARTDKIELASGMKEAGSQTVRSGDQELKGVAVRAVGRGHAEIERIELKEGRWFNDEDQRTMANVCVISEDVKARLFPSQSALGKLVQLPGITLEVVGVSAKPKASFGPDNPKTLVLPLSTAQKKWIGGKNLDLILMRAKPGAPVAEAVEEVWQILMAKSNNKPIYRVDSNESILKVFQQVIGVAGAILAAIAALSLLVGGIGIMNIMLVSVTERTREIGLRKAVGATKVALLTQFLVEAGTLSLVGGLIGMFIAWSLGNIVNLATVFYQWPNEDGLATPFPLLSAILAAAFSALIGMVFGLYPALNAAKLDPIVALRHE